MIVISGALVLMAAVLLFIGLLAGSSLTAIYVSIGLSIVAAVFLWLGINQRPVEVPAEAGARGGTDRRERPGRPREDEGGVDEPSQHRRAAGDRMVGSRAKVPLQPPEVTQQLDVMSDDLVEESDGPTVAAAIATGAGVFVVSGFPRYHLEECPAIIGNDEAESLPIGEARELGFVPCGACRPDSEIAESTESTESTQSTQSTVSTESTGSTVSRGGAESAAGAEGLPHTSNGSSAPIAAERVTSPTRGAAPPDEPELIDAPPAVTAQQPVAYQQPSVPTAPSLPAAPQPPDSQQWQQVAQPPIPPVADQPPVAAQPPVATQPPAAPAPAAEQVVVLPGKARFHRPDCRLVSGPESTEALNKTDAVRQGYLACAICKP